MLTFVVLQADDIQEAVAAFSEDTAERQLLMNIEYKGLNGDCVS